MAVYAIGDVQGCYEELRELLEQIAFDPGRDRLWLTGDLVNRGPGSLETLRFVRGLGDAATTVLGNHDLHLLAVAAGGGRGLRRADTLGPILAAPDRDELLDWLARQPLMVRDATLGWTMVHAGLAPEWDLDLALRCAEDVSRAMQSSPAEFYAAMYGNDPDRWSDDLAGLDRLRFTVNCMTRVRFVARDGRLLLKYKGGLDGAPAGADPWFRAPGRRTRGERVVFGHWSALGYYAGDGVVSLDSGCVWGGALTAQRLDQAAAPVQLACRGALDIGAPEDAPSTD
jgi:bis(5'-nucleosyl)-tetraphosphatase (symmetrical)